MAPSVNFIPLITGRACSRRHALSRSTAASLFTTIHQRAGCRHKTLNPTPAGAAPSQLFLGIENSMAAASGDRAVCAVTLYSPYWLDNRTGLDLDFQVGSQGLVRRCRGLHGVWTPERLGTAGGLHMHVALHPRWPPSQAAHVLHVPLCMIGHRLANLRTAAHSAG